MQLPAKLSRFNDLETSDAALYEEQAERGSDKLQMDEYSRGIVTAQGSVLFHF